MYIWTQIVGLFLTIYLLALWCTHKKLNTSSEDIFFIATIVTIASQILDMCCQFTMSNYFFEHSRLFTTIVIDAYLISIPLTVFAMLLYTNITILDADEYKKFSKVIIISMIASSLITILLPLDWVYDPKCSIPVGSAVTFTYFVTLVYLVFLLVELLRLRKRMSRLMFITNSAWLMIVILGGFIQFIFISTSNTPIISLIFGMGILALYLAIENPGSKYDYEFDCYHYETFMKYITEIIGNRDLQSLLYINLSTRNNDEENINKVFKLIINECNRRKDVSVFKGLTNELIITSREFINLQKIASNITGYIGKVEKDTNYQVTIHASIALLPNMNIVSSYSLLRELLNKYRINNNLVDSNIHVFTINNKSADEFNEDIKLANIIDDAIKKDSIEIRYQLLKSTDNNKNYTFEAITNIIDADGNMLRPIDYFKIADKYDKYLVIDELAFNHVCKTLSKISGKNTRLNNILIRLSVQALENKYFAEKFTKIISNYSVLPNYICLEITNANAISERETLLNNITTLQELGVTFAIGGFGSGESNLNYFIDLPMNIVKFDQSMLDNAIKSSRAATIMKDITDLAHSLDYKVVAVGVDSDEEYNFVKDCNVEMVVGKDRSSVLTEELFIEKVTTLRDEEV